MSSNFSCCFSCFPCCPPSKSDRSLLSLGYKPVYNRFTNGYEQGMIHLRDARNFAINYSSEKRCSDWNLPGHQPSLFTKTPAQESLAKAQNAFRQAVSALSEAARTADTLQARNAKHALAQLYADSVMPSDRSVLSSVFASCGCRQSSFNHHFNCSWNVSEYFLKSMDPWKYKTITKAKEEFQKQIDQASREQKARLEMEQAESAKRRAEYEQREIERRKKAEIEEAERIKQKMAIEEEQRRRQEAERAASNQEIARIQMEGARMLREVESRQREIESINKAEIEKGYSSQQTERLITLRIELNLLIEHLKQLQKQNKEEQEKVMKQIDRALEPITKPIYFPLGVKTTP